MPPVVRYIDPIYEYFRLTKISQEGQWICRRCGSVVPDDSRIRQWHRDWHRKLENA